jgi:hypothetical protein
MPDRPNANAADDEPASFSTAVSRGAPVPRRSRWQLVTASVMLALWVTFLIAMALYSS